MKPSKAEKSVFAFPPVLRQHHPRRRWGDGIFIGESLQQELRSPWAFTLTERVPEAFEIPLADWAEKISGQSEALPFLL